MSTRVEKPSAARAALAAGLALALAFAASPALGAPNASPTAASAVASSAVEPSGTLPMRFEPNVGQLDERVEFVARGGGYTLFLTPGESVAVLDLTRRHGGAEARRPEQAVVRTRLVGANAEATGVGIDELPGVTNYFLGNDPSRWRTGIVSFAAVRYREVYPGVDLVYYGSGGDLEYDFVVAPGADPSAIRMQVTGAERIRVDEAGDLVLEVAGNELRQRAPAIYQEGPAGRERVSGGFVVRGEEVSFAVGGYDPTRPLVVDPVIAYSTYIGSNFPVDSSEWGEGIAVDADGSAYVTGSANSVFFPTVPPQPANGSIDAFVAKIDATGSLVYATLIGGNGHESSSAIALGADGSAFVTGETGSPDFPTLSALQASPAAAGDVFVTKLSPSGTSLVYSTYLGGGGFDSASCIAVDADENVYVAGNTNSSNFPVAQAFQTHYRGGAYDAFVTKIAPQGSSLLYSTYLGGSGDDRGQDIALGANGSAYVVGYTYSMNFPTAAAFQANHAGGFTDAFVTKFSPSGATLAYSTYLGGDGADHGEGVAVGADGSAYVTGLCGPHFPIVNPVQSTRGGEFDAFATKLSPSGSALVYSTYLGGDYDDTGYAIAVGADGSAYVTGYTRSPDFPLETPVDGTYDAFDDAFVTKLSPSGSSLTYSTYLGGGEYDYGMGIAVGADGSAYVLMVAYELESGEVYPPDTLVTRIAPGSGTTPGVYVPTSGAWFLRNSSSSGAADLAFAFGAGGLGYVPIAGDWDGDGVDTVGLYGPTAGTFFVKNANAPGAADSVFTFGAGGAGLVPLAGDWNGDGVSTVGLYDPASGAFFLTNANAPGPAAIVFTFGAGGAGLVPIAGDWNGDGISTVGLYAPASGAFFLRNANAGGAADLVFTFGAGGAGFVPLAGDWDGDGRHTVGLAATSTGTFFLRNANAPGAADLVFAYGPPGATPLVGDWDGQ